MRFPQRRHVFQVASRSADTQSRTMRPFRTTLTFECPCARGLRFLNFEVAPTFVCVALGSPELL